MTATIQQTVEDWAEMVIQIWIERMAALKVSNAWLHADSFAHHIYSSAGGNVSKIEFAFNYYLKFTDMGVGNGISLANRAQMNTRRQQRLWYSKTFLLEVRKLTNMLAAQHAHNAAMIIVENISDNASRWTKK